MTPLPRCPRCNGNVLRSHADEEPSCIQCGWSAPEDQPPLLLLRNDPHHSGKRRVVTQPRAPKLRVMS